MRGYEKLIGRVQNLVDHPELPSTERAELAGLLDYHRSETAARQSVHDYLEAAERHVKAGESLRHEAARLNVHIPEVRGWADWQNEARRLLRAGTAILADDDTYGVYLDTIEDGPPRARRMVDQLRSRIEDGRVQAAKSKELEARRDSAPMQEEGIAYILEDPDKLRELRNQLNKRDRKMGRHHRRSRGRSM